MAVTMRNLRHALAFSLDDLGIQVVSSGSSTGGVMELLKNPTTGAATTKLNARWIYVSTGSVQGQQQRIRSDGLTPSTGAFLVYPDWVAPAATDEVDLTGLFPVRSNPVVGVYRSPQDSDADYFTICNRALGRLLIPSRITIPITTSDSYPLAAYPWLDRFERFMRDGDDERSLRILGPAIIAGQRPMSAAWRGWHPVFNGTSTVLEVDAPFDAATGNLTLEVMRPANTLGSGVEVTSITSDDQTVDVAIEDFLPAAKAEAYAVLAMRPSNPFPRAVELATFWSAEAKAGRFYDHSLSAPSAPAGPAGQEAA